MSAAKRQDTKPGEDVVRGSALRRFRAALRSRAYYGTLRRLHQAVRPRTYLEIGIRKGDSLALATTATVAVGIDPAPMLAAPPAANARIFPLTSDDFFATCDVRAELGGRELDMAFIDGMHLFEFVVRDFANVERFSSPGTVVVLHDCLPVDAVSAARERSTSLWTGDVWKVVPVLRRYRPDLRLTVIDAPPSGLVIVESLDPASTVLADNMERILDEFTDVGLARFEESRDEIRSLVADLGPTLERLGNRRREERAGVLR
jgi:predicted O-methyltransferase YrrM